MQADTHGCLDLGGLLKITAQYNSSCNFYCAKPMVCLSVCSRNWNVLMMMMMYPFESLRFVGVLILS
jgi:hypothetical protein